VGTVHKIGGGRGRSLSVFENSDVDKEVGNALRKVRQQVMILIMGVRKENSEFTVYKFYYWKIVNLQCTNFTYLL
jgi:hypothetical protein